MYSIEYNDIVIASIGLVVYIGGKLWMYYNTNDRDTNDTKGPKKGVIKRGTEWPEQKGIRECLRGSGPQG